MARLGHFLQARFVGLGLRSSSVGMALRLGFYSLVSEGQALWGRVLLDRALRGRALRVGLCGLGSMGQHELSVLKLVGV